MALTEQHLTIGTATKDMISYQAITMTLRAIWLHHGFVLQHYTYTTELQTFRTQDLSFPRTKGPYGELSFPGTKVPGNFRSRSRGTKVPWNFRSRALSFPLSDRPSRRFAL